LHDSDVPRLIDETGTWLFLSLTKEWVTTTEDVNPSFMGQVWYLGEGEDMLDITDPIRMHW
jgi:hypothetical protein